jgi:outer membrane protein TolC
MKGLRDRSRPESPRAVIRCRDAAIRPGGVNSGRAVLPLPARPGPGSRRRLFLTGLLALAVALAGLNLPAPAAEPASGDNGLSTQGPLNFDGLVHLALRQSPYFTKSSIEIQIRRLDESDSRFGMIPPVTFRTYYFVNRPRNVEGLSSQPYNLSFDMNPYNPVGSFFTLQAQKLASQIAILAHLKTISKGLQNLGKLFLDLSTLKRLAADQTDLVQLARENCTYAENRRSIGTGTSLEVRLAEQELELARNEQERIRRMEGRTLEQVKGFVGLKGGQSLTLDLRDARGQVLGKFDPAAATLEMAKDRSYDLKIVELKKGIQGYNVALAKASILPSLLFTTQTPDPLSLNSSHGLYVGFGLELPVWDGFKRIRNVSRQKAILKQFGNEKDMQDLEMSDQWLAAQGEVQEAATALKLAEGQEELARLKGRQAEIRYQAGSAPLPVYLESRKAILEAHKNTAVKAMNYQAAVLKLRQLSGDLGQSYVDQSAWQN